MQTISRSTERIMLRFKLGWKVHIRTFLEIYGRPTNSYGQRKTTCLNSRLKSTRNIRKVKKHCFLVYYEFQSIQGFLNALVNKSVVVIELSIL